MKLPKFEPGQRVCFLGEAKNQKAICSMVVGAVWYSEKSGWWYELVGATMSFPERDVLTFTEAFGEYYEKTNYKRNI